VRSEEPPEASVEPTTINVRSEGLKLSLALLKNRVSGLTIDYQNVSENKELHKWLKIIDDMFSVSAPSPEGLVAQILAEAARPPASQPRHLKGPEGELHEDAEPTTINVRSEGLKLSLALLKNRVSGLTIDYQDISESGELRRWIRIIEDMISESAPSPESVPRALGESARPPPSQPKPPKEEQEEPPEENDYRKVVLHAVDVSLDKLGHDQKHAVLSYLENEYGFREKDIPDNPRTFVRLLYELLSTSAQALEGEIISNIRIVWAAPGDSLEAVVRSLKEHYQTKAPAEVTAEDHESVEADARD